MGPDHRLYQVRALEPAHWSGQTPAYNSWEFASSDRAHDQREHLERKGWRDVTVTMAGAWTPLGYQ